MKRIVVRSLGEAAEVLRQHKEDIEAHTKDFVEKLAKRGEAVASSGFQTAQYAGVNDTTVTSAMVDDRSARITATGTSAPFIEFGTGDMVHHPPVESSTFDISVGSYSRDVGTQQFWNTGYWFYGGHLMSGSYPSMPMYHAQKEIEDSVAEVAREVYG